MLGQISTLKKQLNTPYVWAQLEKRIGKSGLVETIKTLNDLPARVGGATTGDELGHITKEIDNFKTLARNFGVTRSPFQDFHKE